MDLTMDERAFLACHKIRPEHVFDARGLSKVEAHDQAKTAGTLFIVGTPCDAGGHRLRTRSGHCIECDTAKIAYIRRHSAPGCVYIAASKRGQILKIGSCSDVKQREQFLSAHKYGGFDDWQIIAWAKTPKMGQIEFDIHKKLAGLTVPGSYEKGGASQETRELFRGDLVPVWQAYHASTKAVEDDRKWRHPGFIHFNFAAPAKSGASR